MASSCARLSAGESFATIVASSCARLSACESFATIVASSHTSLSAYEFCPTKLQTYQHHGCISRLPPDVAVQMRLWTGIVIALHVLSSSLPWLRCTHAQASLTGNVSKSTTTAYHDFTPRTTLHAYVGMESSLGYHLCIGSWTSFVCRVMCLQGRLNRQLHIGTVSRPAHPVT